MKYGLLPLLPLLAALALCGCDSVACKKPVGDPTAELKPEIWNGKWKDGDGSILVTKIKDAKLGTLEAQYIRHDAPPPAASPEMARLLASASPAPSPTPEYAQPVELQMAVRELGPDVIVSITGADDSPDGWLFARVVPGRKKFILYPAAPPVFATLVKQGKIAGVIRKKGGDMEPHDSSLLESFSGEDYQRLKREGVDMKSLFAPKSWVLVRVK